MIHQDLPHRRRRHRKEVAAILKRRILRARQLQIRFIEQRSRLQRLKSTLEARAANPLVPAAELQGVRAVEVLERIGTPVAREVLRATAAGPPSRLANDAHRALQRLESAK